ncbi:flagellin [Enterobacter sp. MYb186]
MAQVISTNSLSLITQNNINKNQSALSSSIERLSSGLRINSAKDDAAGQAIANRFTSNIKGLTQAARNANDGISLAQTTEGALSEINNNLQRVRELTVQATTGTNSDSDLSSIQDEIKSRLDEIDRVSGQTQFNGVNVLAKNNTMNIQVGANDGQSISIDLKKIDSSTLGLTGFNVAKASTVTPTAVAGTTTYADSGVTLGAATATSIAADATLTASSVVFDKSSGEYYASFTSAATPAKDGVYKVDVNATTGAMTVSAASAGDKLAAAPAGATSVTKVQTGTNSVDTTAAAQTLSDNGVTGADNTNVKLVALTAKDSNGNNSNAGFALQDADGNLYATNYDGKDPSTITAKTISYKDSTGATQTALVGLGGLNGHSEVAKIDGKTYDAANASAHDFSDTENPIAETITKTTTNPLAALDTAIASVDKFRSSLGAVQNRLDSAVTNLNNTTTNLSEAQSRIQDADYATEVSNMSKAQIIQQAGNSVLAKANQVPQQVLSLLQG